MRLSIALLSLGLCLVLAEAKIIPMRIGIPPAEAPNARAKAPQWGQITQRLNNFDANDERTWSMRYLSNGQFFKNNGPMFIFIGGEWGISSNWLMSGMMFDMARDHGGYMFYTEHRFYGESYPLGDFSSASLEYMASYQALADLAHFIEDRKASIPGFANSKVVVVGASYSASLATWARVLYPDLVDAAYASSGPLTAVEDFYRYLEVVGLNYNKDSEECWWTISDGIQEMEKLMETQNGRDELRSILDICNPITGDEPNRAHYFNLIATLFSSIVQYGQPGDISRECRRMKSVSGSAFHKVAWFVKFYYGGHCIGDYDNFVQNYENTSLSLDSSRQWLFQTCTEFGFFQTSNSNYQPFGRNIPVGMFRRWCKDIFGPEYDTNRIQEGIAYSNSIYGSLTPKTSRVVSIHGKVDPWHAIGLTSDLNDEMPAFLIDGASHCADLFSMSSSDSQQMREAKQSVKDYIAEWIR